MNYTPEDLPQFEDYKECLVAFVDILGFNDKVEAIKNPTDFFEVGKLLYTIKETANSYSSADGLLSNFQITAVSDSAIITVPFDDQIVANGLVQILQAMQYQLLALDYKTLVRGYVCKGPVYHKEGLIFGRGYNQAYSREKELCGPPRIIFSPEIIEYAKKVISQYSGSETMVTLFDFLIEDKTDGQFFVDYLNRTGMQRSIPKELFVKEMKTVEMFIEKSLHEFKDTPNVYSKYVWLEKYYKQSMRE